MKSKQFLYLTILILALVWACDSFQDDVAPYGDGELELKEGITAMPNTTLYIDLTKSLYSAEAVKFQISSAPYKGSASISDEALLQYIPNQSFLSGTDFFAVAMINANGSVIDTDSIYIHMTTNADSLPCFNGALSDYYSISTNEVLVFNPMINDGYCADNTAGAVINFLTDPAHGTVVQQDLFTYQYTPETDYNGADSFMYELILVDQSGTEYYSLSEITVYISDSAPCDSLTLPYQYTLSDSSDYVDIWPFESMECEIDSWTLTILEVAHGEAEVYNGLIRYYPGSEQVDSIQYTLSVAGETYFNTLTIFLEGDGSDSNCMQAMDDVYELTVEDSIGTSSNPYIFNVFANDEYCKESIAIWEYSVELLMMPDMGTAYVNSDQKIEYYNDGQLAADSVSAVMMYRVCIGSDCDSAYVYLNFH